MSDSWIIPSTFSLISTKIAKSVKIPVVEDNCEAVGASYIGNLLGTLGDVGILSFDQGKMIATGEGGMWRKFKGNLGKLN